MAHYGTLANALAYHAARGNAAWSGGTVTDPLRTAALTRATTVLDGRYGARYPGTRTDGRDQDLAWPRTNAVDVEGNEIGTDETPVEIENACYEMALVELVDPGSLSPKVTPGKIKIRARVEGAVDVTYRDAGTSGQVPIITTVDDILRPLLCASGASVSLLRV